jgi:hypothetical protein
VETDAFTAYFESTHTMESAVAATLFENGLCLPSDLIWIAGQGTDYQGNEGFM